MLQCPLCSAAYADLEPRWRCTCGGALDYIPARPAAFPSTAIAARPGSLWRYREALPVAAVAHAVTLGEGMTPLLTAPWGGGTVRFKLEGCMPTGSFKDRGATLLVSMLRALGVRECVEDSSGNAGAALAAYAAAAGICCRIFTPAAASPGKQAQIGMYGAELVRVPGPRSETTRAVLMAAAGSFYASHNWVPYYLEGTKTLAFEVCEQLGWRVPDSLILPCGYGSLVLGAFRGFSELLAAGVIDRLPRLFAVEAAVVAPLAAALATGGDDVPAVPAQPTMAEGIACAQPVRGRALLHALRASGGSVLTVSEDEIAAAWRALAQQGLYVEPTAAAAPAAALRLGQAVGEAVIVLSGTGLKATDRAVAALGL